MISSGFTAFMSRLSPMGSSLMFSGGNTEIDGSMLFLTPIFRWCLGEMMGASVVKSRSVSKDQPHLVRLLKIIMLSNGVISLGYFLSCYEMARFNIYSSCVLNLALNDVFIIPYPTSCLPVPLIESKTPPETFRRSLGWQLPLRWSISNYF